MTRTRSYNQQYHRATTYIGRRREIVTGAATTLDWEIPQRLFIVNGEFCPPGILGHGCVWRSLIEICEERALT